MKAMREIIGFAKGCGSRREETEFAKVLSAKLRAAERSIHEAAGLLETEIQDAVRGTTPMTTGLAALGGNQNEKEQKTNWIVRA